MRKIILAFMAIVVIFLFYCAASTSIGDIRSNPNRYQDKKVTLSGTVDETITLPILGIGVYQLNDGTGSLWVKPREMTAEKGDHVRVTGTIRVGLTIAGRSFGLILIESKSEEADDYY